MKQLTFQGTMILAAVCAVAGGGSLDAQTWDVQTLRDAVASGGDVLVPAGTYLLDEPLVIDTQVELTFEPGSVLTANWDKWGDDSPVGIAGTGPWDAVVHILEGADGSQLHGLNIDGGGNRLRGLMVGAFADTGGGNFQWVGPDNLEVAGLYVSDVGEHGAHISETQNSVFRDAEFFRTQQHPGTGQGGAIRVNRSSDVLVENVHVRRAGGKGIAVTANSSNVTVKDSVVYDTQRDAGDGIYFNSSHDSTVINGRVFDPQGNALKISRQNTGIQVIDSFFNKNDRGPGRALHLQGGKESDVSGSIFLSQLDRTAIRVADHPNPTLVTAEDNDLHDNHLVRRQGGYLTDSGANTIYENNAETRRPLISWMSDFGLVGMPMHNLTTGEVHFDGGGFEIGRVGEAPGAHNTLFGQWSSTSGDTTIVDEATTGIAPLTGTRFVRFQGGADGIDRPRLGSSDPDTGSAGDETSTRLAFRVDEGILRVRLHGNGGFFADILFNDDGTIEGHYGETVSEGVSGQSGRFTLNATHDVGQWNEVEISYLLGDDESFLSVNGGTSELVGPRAVATTLGGINFRNEGNAPLLAYIDAVPEPGSGSMLLLGLGSLLSLAVLRRSRPDFCFRAKVR